MPESRGEAKAWPGAGPSSRGRRAGRSLAGAGPGLVGSELGDERGGLRTAAHVELGEDAGDVVLDGLLRPEQPVADLPVGQAVADELQDAAFLRGQRGQGVLAGALAEPPQHLGGALRVEERAAGRDRTDGADEVRAVDLLEDVA